MNEIGGGEREPSPFQSETALNIREKIQTGKGEVNFQEIKEACGRGAISDTEGRELATLLGERFQREKEELKEQTEKDYVTGLYNRRFFEERLSSLLDELGREERRERAVGSVGVLMGDIDNLKDVNDIHGHQAGDELLKRAANAFRESVRDTDIPARWGGDEIVAILIDDVTEETIQEIAERIETKLSRSQIEVPGAVITPSVSLGFSFIRRGEKKEPEQLTREAEQIMYKRKKKK